MNRETGGKTRVVFYYPEHKEIAILGESIFWETEGVKTPGEDEAALFAEINRDNQLARIGNSDSLFVLRLLLKEFPSAVQYLRFMRHIRPQAYSPSQRAVWKCEPPLPDVRRDINSKFHQVKSSARVKCPRGLGMALSLGNPG